MVANEKMDPNKIARIAGVLYIVIFSLGIFGQLFVLQNLIVSGDPGTTLKNLMESESQFRFVIFAELIRNTCLILLIIALYKLLIIVNKTIALIMLVLAIVSTGLAMLNLLNYFAVLLMLSGADYLTLFAAGQHDAIVMYLLDLYDYGAFIPQFLSFWLLLTGYLVFKSGFLPRILGVLLIIGSLGFVIDSITFILLPNFDITISVVTFLGELFFALWLLIKGVNVEEWEKRAQESA